LKLQEYYDNLTKEQFDDIMNRTQIKLLEIKNEGIKIEVTKPDGLIKFNDENVLRTFNIYKTVRESRSISIKQFKCLSAFIKLLNTSGEKKQF
jgi:hypothetical protein